MAAERGKEGPREVAGGLSPVLLSSVSPVLLPFDLGKGSGESAAVTDARERSPPPGPAPPLPSDAKKRKREDSPEYIPPSKRSKI